jgi:uncharacterized protein (DUF1778 family)
MTPIKSERLNLRLDEISKKKIEQAAAVLQSSVNSFIIATVLEKAEEIIQRHEEMILSDRDRDIFLDALVNPPVPNEALRKAFQEYSEQVESNV